MNFDQHMIRPSELAKLSTMRTQVYRVSSAELDRSEHPALAIGQLGQSGLDQTTKNSQKHWACKSGCGMCCYEPVTITEVEAIYIAQVLRDNMTPEQVTDAIGELRTHVDRTGEIPDRHKWLRLRVRCPFLNEANACSIYDARPMNCRAHNSLKVSDCELSVENPDYSVRTDVGAHHAYGAITCGMQDAIFERGLRLRPMEFGSALLCALETPDAQARWQAGEDVFGNCAPAVPSWKPAQ